MYTGQWAQDFVRIVKREGGKVTALDMKRYEPIWSEPYKETVFGHTIYVNGPPHRGAFGLFVGLNLAEALNLDQKGPYWTDAETLRDLARIGQIAVASPELGRRHPASWRAKASISRRTRSLARDSPRAVAPLLGAGFWAAARERAKTLECDCRGGQGRKYCGRDAHDQRRDLGRHGHRRGRNPDS